MTKNNNTLLKWTGILNLAKNGNPAPARKVVQTDAEWPAQLSHEQYTVTRNAGTERPFSSHMCSLLGPGLYSCLCCGTLLFDATQKFEFWHGLGFVHPADHSRRDGLWLRWARVLERVETTCNTCNAH